MNEHNHFIRKNNNYSPELIKQVITFIQTTQVSCRKAAKYFNIPKSTVQRWWKKNATVSIDSNSENNIDTQIQKIDIEYDIKKLQECLLQISSKIECDQSI